MAVLSPVEIAAYASSAGFTGGARATMVAICLAESSGDTNARNVNTDGSVDRGLCQINNVYHPEVTRSCAYDPACSLKAAYAISQQGTNFCPWSTYDTSCGPGHNNAYRQFLTVANAATSSGASGSSTPNAQTAQLAQFMQGFYSTANITQPFGCTAYTAEPAPPAGVSCPTGHFHYGIDFGEQKGASIPAIDAGVVVFAGFDNSGFGIHVITRDSAGNQATYGHMLGTAVKVGDHIQIGTTLGYVDSTGNSTGNHVHVQLNDAKGRVYDPWPTIQSAIVSVSAGNTTDNSAAGSTWPLPGAMINGKVGSIQGFEGVAQTIGGAEAMVSYQDYNPITATIANLQALALRGAVIVMGFLLIMAALRSLSAGEGVISGLAGLPEAGVRAGISAVVPETAVATRAAHGAQTLGPVAGLTTAA